MESIIKEENGKIKVVLIDKEEVAKATCYFEDTPKIEGETIGTIGEFTANNELVGIEILKICKKLLKEKNKKIIVAPMNGNTWRQYRTLKYSNGEPNFALENVNSFEYNSMLEKAGFEELYTYTSTKGLISDAYNSKTLELKEKELIESKINIRNFNKQNYVEDLKKIYNVAVKSFYRNPLYTPIEEKEFIEQYTKYIQMVDEELILIAEQEGKEIGFIFCIPDNKDTIIVKTVAVLSEYEKYSIGNIMLNKISKKATEKNFKNWIFAFMYSNNTSQRMAKRNNTEVIREYALYGKKI